MIVAGFGFRHGAGLPSLRAAFVLAQQGRVPVTQLVTVSDKTAALAPLAALLGLPLTGVPADVLACAATLTRSAASLAAWGTGSVAEACALTAAGPGARLLGPRCISSDRMATCALAEGFVS
ncbi:cobalamin biosynthesis protein [Novosphingobium sp. 2638]|uniref:Cobalamin biosynthesis protein n=1 Tax=Novosphingobium beihaiensis TaxID=2930389 RepID=A0ABT0BVA2_9SPHN|nr:cobalamin biosynthesis protein [Novosphingobium beihaiensis]MCJ2189005.1 cobalamin biosynthesis protein [Novosphingobium beihaiensis]